MSYEGELIELMKFDSAARAHLVKTHLESAGIPCMVVGEDSLGFQPILTSRTGGIRLMIREHDREAALALLEEAGQDDDADDMSED